MPGENPVTFQNFFIGSQGFFLPCDPPKKEPDHFSEKSGSKYWFFDDKSGQYMVRESSHWGFNVARCAWFLVEESRSAKECAQNSYHDDGGTRCGIVNLSDLRFTRIFSRQAEASIERVRTGKPGICSLSELIGHPLFAANAEVSEDEDDRRKETITGDINGMFFMIESDVHDFSVFLEEAYGSVEYGAPPEHFMEMLQELIEYHGKNL